MIETSMIELEDNVIFKTYQKKQNDENHCIKDQGSLAFIGLENHFPTKKKSEIREIKQNLTDTFSNILKPKFTRVCKYLEPRLPFGTSNNTTEKNKLCLNILMFTDAQMLKRRCTYNGEIF